MPAALIVGPGRAGTTLALALDRLGYEVQALGGGAEARARFRALLGVAPAADAFDLRRTPDLIVLSVPDRRIAPVAEELAQHGAFRPGQLVVHLSGALPSAVLAPASGLGAGVLALHPLVAFADPGLGLAAFTGAVCTLEGQPAPVERGAQLVQELGGIPWAVSPLQKTRIHAAAVLASNGVIGLLAAGIAACAESPADRDKALSALLTLARGTLGNVAAHGLEGAQTGPVQRGDTSTVRRHLAVLSGEAADVYRALIGPLTSLAQTGGAIDQDVAQELLLLASEVRPGWNDE